MQAGTSSRRQQNAAEERLNTGSHALGLLFAIGIFPVLVLGALREGTALNVLAVGLYAGSMVFLFAVSMVYHALPPGLWKQRLRRTDHASIYLFIAGTYTPFALGPLAGPLGWTLFGVVWGIAAVGVPAKLFDKFRHPLWSTALYVAMGWVALAAMEPMYQRIGTDGMQLILAGGVCYTAGAIVYLFNARFLYLHFVWHLFVLAGAVLHFIAVLKHGLS